jgi:hypothetical protein
MSGAAAECLDATPIFFSADTIFPAFSPKCIGKLAPLVELIPVGLVNLKEK